MRWKTLLFVCLFGTTAFSQQNDNYMLWTNVGVTGDLVKKTDWSAEISTRFDNSGVATFFPQIGINYKLTKWLRPSVEYRFIVDKNKYGNFKAAHRLNFNAKLKKNVDRLGLGLRVRYQYAFNNRGSFDYDADFDNAFRFKPEISYDIPNFILSPKISSEFFYNPSIGENGRRFDKMRISIGASLDLNNDHDISFKYQLDKRFFDYNKGVRHVLAIAYEYSL